MSLFGKILSKLGFGNDDKAAAPTSTTSASPSLAPSAPSTTAAAPVPVGVVDVVEKLEGLATNHPEKLNWKVSIVDLMKLLGLDSSLAERKALAVELGCPAEKMTDSAQMNIWLHKTVLKKIADNGGNVPADLLD